MLEAELMRDIDQQTINDGISGLDGVVSVEMINPRSLRLKFSGGLDRQATLLSELAKMNIGLISFRPSTSSLEDSYLNLIKDTM